MAVEEVMNITHYVCGSCAVASIANLGLEANAESAMRTFCSTELGKPNKFVTAEDLTFNLLVNSYIFCAGPEIKKDEGGNHHSKDHWPKYGTEFAAYIVDNGLGEVVTNGPKLNKRHHPTHTAQLWSWSPKQEALEEWWRTRINDPLPETISHQESLYDDEDEDSEDDEDEYNYPYDERYDDDGDED
jgi:hypothetical protein